MELVGRQMVDFLNQEKQRVVGIKLHLVGLDDRVQGNAVFTQFINETSPLYSVACSLPFGPIMIEYGPRGKIQGICSVK